MIISKDELSRALGNIKNIIPRRTPMPILQGVLITGDVMIATNLKMTIQQKLTCSTDTPIYIPAESFDFIGSLPNNEGVTLETTESENQSGQKNFIVKIQSGKIKARYSVKDPSDFPEKTMSIDESTMNVLTMDSDRIQGSINHVLYAVSKEGSSTAMNSLCIERKENWLSYVGLDGHVIAWDRNYLDTNKGDEMSYDAGFQILIPRDTAEKLSSMNFGKRITIAFDNKTAFFSGENILVKATLVAAQYFNYRKIVPENKNISIKINKNRLIDAIVRASLSAKQSKCPIILNIEGNVMRINIKSSNNDFNEEIELLSPAEQPLTIGFNPLLLKNSLSVFDDENVNINFTGEKAPAVVSSDNLKLLTVVLPVNINTAESHAA